MALETKKSHSLTFASWRTGTASGISQSESKGLRTREANGESPRIRKPQSQELLTFKDTGRWTFQLKKKEFALPSPSPTDWIMSPTLSLYSLLSGPNHMLISSRTFVETHSEIMYFHLLEHHLGQSRWHIQFDHHSPTQNSIWHW